MTGADADALCPALGKSPPCDVTLACLRKLNSAQRRCFPEDSTLDFFECDGSRANRRTATPTSTATMTPTGTLSPTPTVTVTSTGLTPSPAGDLAYTMHPWAVSGSRLHAAGWRPRWTNEEVLAELLEEVAGRHTVAGRRLGRKDATTLGAAGATVALVGTAAIVRRARKARRRA